VNAIVEYLDYQIPVTQLKGPKADADMQAAKRDCNAPPTSYLNIWLSNHTAHWAVERYKRNGR